MRATPIMDPHGWGEPVVAKTLLVPADWRVEGGIRWRLEAVCVNYPIEERFVASSPDGQMAFEIFPSIVWEWGNNPVAQTEIRMRGCQASPPLDAAGVFRHHVMSSFRPGAYVREVRSSPEAARGAYEDIYSQWGAYFQARGTSLRTDAMSAIIEYQREGRAYEERIMLTLAEAATPSVLGPVYMYWTPQIYAFRALKGRLENDERLFAMMAASLRTSPLWERAVVQLMINIGMRIIEGAGQRAGIWRQAMNEIGETRSRTWWRSQESLSRVSLSWSRALRGVDGYVDPMTQETVELPTGYNSSWSNGNGVYVLTPDPSFDPNVAFRDGNWHRLERVPN